MTQALAPLVASAALLAAHVLPALAATVPRVVVVHPSVPVKTMAELAAYLKANPGKLSYTSAGNGTPSHLGMEYYKKANGVDPVHVP
jgi:tripartite-type tricarboxylate transporter receptor subunit TctC